MRVVSSFVGAAAAFTVAAAVAVANQPQFHFRLPLSRSGSPITSRSVMSQRVRSSASCSGAGFGVFAFDSSTLFMTNFSATEQFGESNLAAAQDSATLDGTSNAICDIESVIGGGTHNLIDSKDGQGNAANASFIGGGRYNTITSYAAFVGAGFSNVVGNSWSGVGSGFGNYNTGPGSFIGAGGASEQMTPGNQITGTDSFLGAGDENTVAASEAFIGSGGYNTISASGAYASIIGGNRNSIAAEYASIIGGYGNQANGAYAIVAGGDASEALGTVSFAAGYHADAIHSGSFVWSDYVSGSTAVKDTAANQYVVRASGGTYVYSNEAATSGVKLAAGSGTWSSLSDRNAKTGLAPFDDASILSKVANLPVGTWQYKSERGVRHAGPMAQDFYRAFGIGEDDRHISSIDEDGVALAAIKALHRENVALRASLNELKAQKGARFEDLALKVAALEHDIEKDKVDQQR
jgi:hypothetical protein